MGINDFLYFIITAGTMFWFFYLFISFINALNDFGKIKTKYHKLRRKIKFFIFVGIYAFAMVLFIITYHNNKMQQSSTAGSSTADGFTIEEYKVEMKVDESNIVDVNEYITINFYETGHHGIYRFIPEWLEYTNKLGETESRKAIISELKAVNDQFTVDTVSGKKRIKIGDPYSTLPVGYHTYTIHYKYDMGNDPYENFDEFIFHAFGDFWGTEIKNASLVIKLPKNFETRNTIKFYSDKYRQNDITSYVDCYVEDNIIYATLSSDYKLEKSLTIDIELPDGYFIGASNNYGITSLVLCLICVAIGAITVMLWFKNGRDFKDNPETIQFYPPENLDASEVGYLYKHDTGRKLSIALIVGLASKGFIKIMESDDKKTITIQKTKVTDINKYINRKITCVKLKDYKPNFFTKNLYTNLYLNKYFPNNLRECIITSDFDQFYIDSEQLIKKGYMRIESDTISNYTESELEKIKKELAEDEFKERPKMTENEELVYNNLFQENEDEIDLSKNHTFYKVFKEVAYNVENKYDDIINDLHAYRCMLFTSILFFISNILFFVSYCLNEDLNPKFKFMYYIAFGSIIVTFIFTLLMKRKNSYGEQMKARIKGFRNYIEVAEKNQIDMLVEKNPNYFYHILPYAYVLGVSKKWIEKFDNVIPTHDMGNLDYSSLDSLDRISDSVYVPSSSSSSGCSSCGGGCSSCGGGCSSCGGGGSW